MEKIKEELKPTVVLASPVNHWAGKNDRGLQFKYRVSNV